MKTPIIILLLALVAFSQMPGSVHMLLTPQKVGGFRPVQPSKLSSMQNEGILKTAILKAREEYSKTHNDNLLEVAKVSEQIVSGINYRIIFNSNAGPVQVTVYCQAWTDTFEVTEMKPFVEEN